jgi:hypothetical protein
MHVEDRGMFAEQPFDESMPDGVDMRSRILVMMLMALLAARDEVLAQAVAALPPAQATPNSEAPSTPEHTGWATLARDAAHDLVAFPRRKSTWTILGIGGVAALATHPADHYVEDAARRFSCSPSSAAANTPMSAGTRHSRCGHQTRTPVSSAFVALVVS